MSKFNTFARRLDAHAREVFAKREELEAAYNKAERASKEARASGNPIAIARADADLMEAKKARDSMRRALRDDSGAEVSTNGKRCPFSPSAHCGDCALYASGCAIVRIAAACKN